MLKLSKRNVLGAAIGCLLTLAVVALFNIGSDGSTAPGNEQQTATIGQIGPKVEKADKNIKVLTGMPESQLIPTMKSITISLGVACNYCHVTKDGQLDTAADDKETKRIARTMMKMVQDVNRTTFHGNPTVSCYTCHRGEPTPRNFATLPVAARPMPPTPGPGQSTPSPQPPASPALPSADEILSNYITAIGSQAGIDNIKSLVTKGTVVNASGSSGTYETGQVAPDKGYEILTTQRGIRQRVLNDSRGWDKNSYGVNPLVDQQLLDLKVSLPLFANLRLKEQYVKMKTARKEKIGEREAYVVDATRPDQKHEHLYFDTTDGLLLRRVSDMDTLIGIVPEQTDFENYRDLEGVKLPGTIRISTMDTQNPTSTRTLDDIKANLPIDAPHFAKPSASP
jgi:Photosynthetic reaction centre cytochrome C subunit